MDTDVTRWQRVRAHHGVTKGAEQEGAVGEEAARGLAVERVPLSKRPTWQCVWCGLRRPKGGLVHGERP